MILYKYINIQQIIFSGLACETLWGMLYSLGPILLRVKNGIIKLKQNGQLTTQSLSLIFQTVMSSAHSSSDKSD